MKLHVEIKDVDTILQNHGLQPNGPVQQLVDTEVMDYMKDYMPMVTGKSLRDQMVMATVIGSGQIDTPGPHAHYLYEGVVYVDPVYKCAGWISQTPGPYYGMWFSRKGVKKVPTDRELQYTGAPMRGKKWFERMKADHKDDILQAAQEIVDRGGK